MAWSFKALKCDWFLENPVASEQQQPVTILTVTEEASALWVVQGFESKVPKKNRMKIKAVYCAS